MKALICPSLGPAENLLVTEVEAPRAGDGEALVKVAYAGLNFFDTLIIAGKYQHKPPFPFSPAAEFAGVVESIGPGVTDIAPGDRVMGNTGWGAAREAIAVPDAAAAVKALRNRLRPGDVVLVKASKSAGLWEVADGLLAEVDQ